MIEFEKFKKVIVKYIEFYKCEDELHRMKIDIFDSPLFETPGFLLDWFWEECFTDEGVDVINWYIFEHRDLADDFDYRGECLITEEDDCMWSDEDKKHPIPMRTIEDLWDYVKDFRK